MRCGLLLADVPGDMQHAVTTAAFSDAVSCDKLKKLVWCQVLLYPGQSGGKETDLNSWKFSFEVLSRWSYLSF